MNKFIKDEEYFSNITNTIPSIATVKWRLGEFSNCKNRATLVVGSMEDDFFRQKILLAKPKLILCNSNSTKLAIPQKTIPYFVENDVVPQQKKIEVSFVGWINNPIRHRLSEIYKNNPFFIKLSKFYYESPNNDSRQNYLNTLGQSRFSLCPRGVASGSYRFWESLKCGSIPILISDEYNLPLGWDWDNTILRIQEKDLRFPNKIDALINKNLYRENFLRDQCFKCFEFFLDVSKYIKTIV